VSHIRLGVAEGATSAAGMVEPPIRIVVDNGASRCRFGFAAGPFTTL